MEPGDQGNIRAPELPQDGYEWKKYGQKFIRNIGKFRSYFRCQRANCNAKKRAEWSPWEPGDLRVVYEGIHTHDGPPTGSGPSSSQGGSSSTDDANRYNLLTQVLGDQFQPYDSNNPNQTGHQ